MSNGNVVVLKRWLTCSVQAREKKIGNRNRQINCLNEDGGEEGRG